MTESSNTHRPYNSLEKVGISNVVAKGSDFDGRAEAKRAPPVMLVDGLEKETASRIMWLAHALPGPSRNELLQFVPAGRLRLPRILKHLVDVGSLVEAEILGAKRVFPPELTDPVAQMHAAALRDADTMDLYLLLRRKALRQRDLLREMENKGWHREKTRRVLHKLQRLDLILRQGGTTKFPQWKARPAHQEAEKTLSNGYGKLPGIRPQHEKL